MSWCFPDGFIGDDPSSKHNARWLGFFLAIAILLILTIQAFASTRVWMMYGMGDNFFGSSAGIDQIAARARTFPNVASVRVFNYYQTQQIANEIMAAPRADHIVIVGYSCGANAASTIGYGLNGHRTVTIATIQPSLWCGGYPITNNVPYAQETYGGCILTLGFGCLQYQGVPGYTGRIVRIKRPDLHPFADLDPNAQNDVLSVIAGSAVKRGMTLHHGSNIEIIRYNGQRP